MRPFQVKKDLSVSKTKSLWIHEGDSRYCQSKMLQILGLFKSQYQYLSSIVNASASNYISNLSRKIIKHQMHKRGVYQG